MDSKTLQAAVGCTADIAASFADPISQTFDTFDLNTIPRQAMFLAQCGHESASFATTEENMNYGAPGLLATFPNYFNATTAAQYARQPEMIANHVYANRMGNGEEASGDGWLFRGRGLIQLTGRANYMAYFKAMDLDPDDTDPGALAMPLDAARSAGYFWASNNLNALADQQLFSAVTQKINGGQNGAPDRLERYHRALSALNA